MGPWDSVPAPQAEADGGPVGGGSVSVAPHLVEIALPVELAAQRQDLLLPLQTDQGFQGLLDDGTLGLNAGTPRCNIARASSGVTNSSERFLRILRMRLTWSALVFASAPLPG